MQSLAAIYRLKKGLGLLQAHVELVSWLQRLQRVPCLAAVLLQPEYGNQQLQQQLSSLPSLLMLLADAADPDRGWDLKVVLVFSSSKDSMHVTEHTRECPEGMTISVPLEQQLVLPIADSEHVIVVVCSEHSIAWPASRALSLLMLAGRWTHDRLAAAQLASVTSAISKV